MRLLLRHKLLAGGTILVLAASAGGAYAATQSGSGPQQAFLNDAAKRLNVSPSRLRSALTAAYLDRLQAAVKAGRLTQAQANRLEQRLESGKLPAFGGPGRPGFPGGPRGLKAGGPLRAAASYLGLQPEQLMADLRSGKSLAQIAKSRGKSVSGLEQAISAAEKARLQKLVTAGWLTKAQEQRLLNRLSTRIDRLVNRQGLGARPMAGAARALPGGPGVGPGVPGGGFGAPRPAGPPPGPSVGPGGMPPA